MDDQKQDEAHPLDIPSFLQRDPVTNTAEFMMSEEAQEIMRERAKPKSRPALSKEKPKEKPKAKKAVAKKPAVKAKKAATKVASKKPVAKKTVKTKPELSVERDQFGLRKGSSRSKAAAMYARKSGATLEEVKEAVGSIQLNVLKGLETLGYVITKERETRTGKRPLTRYWLKAAK